MDTPVYVYCLVRRQEQPGSGKPARHGLYECKNTGGINGYKGQLKK